ncbi:asparagine synthase (glutamine-hydrolyzing) [Alicyclobacillus mengziensis]|uniref:asparagine synthase (glutamine-hydrolyzing) n=1 Tax=Alicyclobacillus mengziensis TaxID=2931921 RepID=A0A9X7Z5H6_9BACL|nr:asparagine synthase (glutamine-hydrolyzing) [Alicyclobacillus mengziensis]QSO46337.1 asparagine synthase (glutamine-hydrolyzing) [Alicyclobacillus mengziensis]
MCGICGIFRGHGNPVSMDELQKMTDTMIHRGPDESGFMVDGDVGLGFRRLSIVDLEHGHQPMTNENRTVWVVCNGEIYNYKSLRNQLMRRGHIFTSNTDTEVIVHLYEEYGIELVHHLRGMFAIAIVDLNIRELFLVRDHFGIKPLYFSQGSDGLRFASELRSLLTTSPWDFSVDEQALWDYFTLQYVPTSGSLIRGMQKVPPAHYIRYHHGVLSMTQYWAPKYQPVYDKPESYYTDAVADALERSVRRHLQADVRVGSFLSSGVDSSTIVALAKQTRPLTTFSVGFEDADAQFDELVIARRTAEALGVEHKSTVISSSDIINRLPTMMDSLEEPLGDPSALALYFLSELASRDVTVVLSGEGSDEIFAGYPIYHEPKSLAMFKYLPQWSNPLLRNLANMMPHGVKGRSFLLRGTTPLERRFLGNIHVFHEETKDILFQKHAFGLAPDATYRLTDPIYQQTAMYDDITRMQMVDLHTWLPGDILFKADKMTMAHSLELRVPFLDVDVFDVASSVPVEYRVRDNQGKYVLRQAVKQWLPDGIWSRPKLGFPVPYRKWLRESMHDILRDAFQSSKFRHFFSEQYVDMMLSQHRSGTRDYGRELWTLLAFLMWEQAFQARWQTSATAHQTTTTPVLTTAQLN